MKHALRALAVALGFFFAFGARACAQNNMDLVRNSTPEERAEYQTDWMAENLALTSEQKTSVYRSNRKYAQQVQELVESNDWLVFGVGVQ